MVVRCSLALSLSFFDSELIDPSGFFFFFSYDRTNPALYIDPFALYRQPLLAALADQSQTCELELEAAKGKLFYVKKYDGDIACFGFGAGVAMSTMDALAVFGGRVSFSFSLILWRSADDDGFGTGDSK